MIALSKSSAQVLDALRNVASVDAFYTANGKTWHKVRIADARPHVELTDRQFTWSTSALQRAGLLADWPGDDRFAAVAIDAQNGAEAA